ncbi:MAG: ribonuclease P protein component [Candidatus Colwellbacteria bacterium RIFCSPLOWO2_12_FULL_44_13]|uniref:Ribonuclease P protein component n=3 Tax=Candidatus Colwelliibacteriota TaxID=1817904 RepID=A0A1G1Z4D6_9BACT|nr:MAG: ribonuclease P protein component [Candidatus Colwellbacteria bacterium RIFCSPHIGHO2_12_FULL_44_17]OGY59483.1 MAG: ribonuclease P protein component [Candidatus Colwellbacteria bacterium RIFCSPLOWO2_02_FULL_44_20b]OGY61485.1 MAG: ribonuclease P protein component [Candidatus Colwellbacteria bacterium RIFCSPLOWO2_12_FULL_44_13]
MLSRKYRVPKTVFALPQKKTVYRNGYFIVKTAPNAKTYDRIAVVVSKNISKTAVKRNKIKRIVSKCMEKALQNKKEGKDLIIIAEKKAKDANEKIISEEIEKIIEVIN